MLLLKMSDFMGEIEKVKLNIIKHELIIESIRHVVAEGQLSLDEELHVMLCLNPTEIVDRETTALGLDDNVKSIVKLQKMKIPVLKNLVEKELNDTCELIEKLSNSTKDISCCELDIPSKVDELQKAAASTSDKVHNLVKRLKILRDLHSVDRMSCLEKHMNSITYEVEELTSSSSRSEDEILEKLFGDVTDEKLERIVGELESQLAATNEVCELKEKTLKKYEENREQLEPLAATLSKIKEEIALKKMALQVFFDYQ